MCKWRLLEKLFCVKIGVPVLKLTQVGKYKCTMGDE